MTSPLPRETITLNAAELKQTIIKVLLSSIKHHYYLMAVHKKFTTFRKCDETELAARLQRQKSSGLANTIKYDTKTNNNPKHK